MRNRPHIAILGAGPIGLEAALAAAEAGFPFTLYEAGTEVAANIRSWGHVRTFTPWDMNVSPRMARALERASREVPSGGRPPFGEDFVHRILEPLGELPPIAPYLRCGVRVRAIGREGLLKHEEIASAERAARPFRLLLRDRDGKESIAVADLVLDCTGTYGNPNSLGEGGIQAPGEKALDRQIERFIPDLKRQEEHWAGRRILLVGAGHSAQTAARDLALLALKHPSTHVVWALRGADFASEARDPLPERGKLHATARDLAAGGSPAITVRRGVSVDELRPENGQIVVTLASRRADGGKPQRHRDEVAVDRVLSLTGSVGDHRLYRQLQVHECYAFAAPMKLSAALLAAAGGSADCLDQQSQGVEALKNPEPGFFMLGSKSYGHNNSFLMRVGYQQVEEVFALLTAG